MSKPSKSRRERYSHTPCHYCGRTMITNLAIKQGERPDPERLSRSLTSEHIYPRSLKGSNDSFNRTPACQRCNNLRGNMPYPAFYDFACAVLRRFPEAPTALLRNALHQFNNHLISVAMLNNQAMTRAVSLALLRLNDEMADRPDPGVQHDPRLHRKRKATHKRAGRSRSQNPGQ